MTEELNRQFAEYVSYRQLAYLTTTVMRLKKYVSRELTKRDLSKQLPLIVLIANRRGNQYINNSGRALKMYKHGPGERSREV
jgi:hypothetical protein